MIDDDGSFSPIRGSFDECVGDVEHAEAICQALDDNASSSRKNTQQCSGWTSSDDEGNAIEQDDEDSESERSVNFKEQRRAHYDEFLQVKELRRKGSFMGEGDESDDDQDNGTTKDAQSASSSSVRAGVKDTDIDEGKPGKSYPPPTANGT